MMKRTDFTSTGWSEGYPRGCTGVTIASGGYRFRMFAYVSSTQMQFSGGYNNNAASGSSSGTIAIPLYVYGYK